MDKYEYSFGHLKWNGESYREDVLILPDGKVVPWRREHKHRLKFSYLIEAREAQPRILVIGTGHDGVMEVPDKVLEKLADAGVDGRPMPTEQALKHLVELRGKGKDVAAALHVTC